MYSNAAVYFAVALPIKDELALRGLGARVGADVPDADRRSGPREVDCDSLTDLSADNCAADNNAADDCAPYNRTTEDSLPPSARR